MTRPRIPAAIAAVLVLAACAASVGTPDATSSDPASSRLPFETVPASASADAVVNGPEVLPPAAWTAIVEDLRRREGDPTIEPTVVKAEPITWNDGSLGCPLAGQVYTQALVDGFHVIVEVAGREYDYRVGAGADVRLCET